MNINNLILENKLGSGMVGTTYLAIYKKKKYAVKIEKIAEYKKDYNLKFQDWREIEFSLNFANNYPEQFIYLYAYDIIDNCPHIQEYPGGSFPTHLPPQVLKSLKEKLDSNFCIRKVYSLIDTTASKIFPTLTVKQLYSYVAQVAYIIWLMNSNGYTHNDLHGENIGVMYVNKNKKINIFNNMIPTFGIQFKAIDYGNVLNYKYKLSKAEKTIFDNCIDMDRVIKKLVTFKTNTKSAIRAKLLNIKMDIDIFNEIKKHVLYKSTNIFSNDPADRFSIFQMLYPDIFQKIYLKEKYVETVYPSFGIDLIDILFLIQNKSNLKKIIKFCEKKLNNIL